MNRAAVVHENRHSSPPTTIEGKLTKAEDRKQAFAAHMEIASAATDLGHAKRNAVPRGGVETAHGASRTLVMLIFWESDSISKDYPSFSY